MPVSEYTALSGAVVSRLIDGEKLEATFRLQAVAFLKNLAEESRPHSVDELVAGCLLAGWVTEHAPRSSHAGPKPPEARSASVSPHALPTVPLS